MRDSAMSSGEAQKVAQSASIRSDGSRRGSAPGYRARVVKKIDMGDVDFEMDFEAVDFAAWHVKRARRRSADGVIRGWPHLGRRNPMTMDPSGAAAARRRSANDGPTADES